MLTRLTFLFSRSTCERSCPVHARFWPCCAEIVGFRLILGLSFRAVSFLLQLFPPHLIITKIKLLYCANPEVAAARIKKNAKASAAKFTAAKVTASLVAITATDGMLQFENVKVVVAKSMFTKEDKSLIDGISGRVQSGRLLALMGPSGAGKTTLLNALAGMIDYADVFADSITLNGATFKKEHLAYVPQFDHLSETFTVLESLMFAARLRMNTPREELLNHCRQLLADVGLLTVKDIRVGKLANGQQKLLSIAIGLVSQPQVLFLDEPTTGLDSTAAEAVVAVVKDIASTGRIVAMTVHQPSATVFGMVDDLVVLSTGALAYFGSVDEAPAYFAEIGIPLDAGSKETLADQMINAVSQDPPGQFTDWNAAFDSSSHGKRAATALANVGVLDPVVAMQRPSAGSKIATLIFKLVTEYFREPGYYIYRTLGCLAYGLFCGSLYYNTEASVGNLNEITSAAFQWNWGPSYFALASFPSFCISRRQALNGYAGDQHTIGQWVLAQFIASIPFCLMAGLAFVVPFFWMAGVTATGPAFAYAIVNTWLNCLVTDAVNWNVVEATKSNIMIAVTLGMVILGVMFIFAGFFIKPSDMVPEIAWIPWTIPYT